MKSTTCFISYSWEDEAHQAWVLKLAEQLVANGINVKLDLWDLHPGYDLVKFMETNVRESEFVLLICTPTYGTRANSRSHGVGFETTIITGELYLRNPEGKFIP